MINVLTEKTYPLPELTKKLPHKRTVNTVRSWCLVGVYPSRCQTAERIKMESVQVAGVTYSSVEAYSRWVSRLTREAERGRDE